MTLETGNEADSAGPASSAHMSDPTSAPTATGRLIGTLGGAQTPLGAALADAGSERSYYQDALAQQRARPGILRRFLPRTLFGRALMIIVTPMVLAQLIATAVFYNRHWETIAERLSKAVAGELALILDMIEQTEGTPDQEAARLRITELATGATSMLLTFEDGVELNPAVPRDWWDPYLRKWLPQALSEKIEQPFRIDPFVVQDWVEISIQLESGVLRVLVPLRRFFSSTIYIFVVWMVGSSALLFSIALIFMRNQIRPIRRLATAAEAFGKGRDMAPFKPEGATEVRQAGFAFIAMQERLRRQIEQRTAFLAGVSHDLRTPLTRMKLQLAMMPENDEARDLQTDISEMEMMIETYLAFVRGEGSEVAAETDISGLLEEIVANTRRGDAALTTAIPPGLRSVARPVALKRALTNLIANAARYGTHVWIEARREANAITILIDDDGPGIPPAQREEVFRPFTRLEPSRNPETGGVGLGLTIARDIVRRHGGDVRLLDNEHAGLRVRIDLPV